MTRERALAGGASAYRRKPVDDSALLNAIASAISGAFHARAPPGEDPSD